MGPGSAAHRRTGRCCASPGKRCAVSGAREQILALHSNSNRTHGFASSRQDLPELCCSHHPRKCRGRREGRVPAGTRGPLCGNCATKFAQRHTGEAKHPAFPAQWFYGLCRALPGERCTIAPTSPQDLAHRLRAPGRHGFTVHRLHRSCARGVRSRLPALQTTFAPTPPASTTSHPACRDDRDNAPRPGVGWLSI
ncbi:hypothetical protein ABID62_002496 [Bradyrhizobium sp. S3.9.1]